MLDHTGRLSAGIVENSLAKMWLINHIDGHTIIFFNDSQGGSCTLKVFRAVKNMCYNSINVYLLIFACL